VALHSTGIQVLASITSTVKSTSMPAGLPFFHVATDLNAEAPLKKI